MKAKKAIRSKHGLTKGISCLITLIAFYGGITDWVGEGRALDVVFDFSKAFGTVSHNILIGKFRKRGLDEWTRRSIEKWLISRAQWVVIRSAG